MLCYIGASRDILPFLEEPMQAVSSELEVLGRHDHPHLTVPFLKAVSEGQVKSTIEKRMESSAISERMNVDAQPFFMTLEYWEDLLCKLPSHFSLRLRKQHVLWPLTLWRMPLYLLPRLRRLISVSVKAKELLRRPSSFFHLTSFLMVQMLLKMSMKIGYSQQ